MVISRLRLIDFDQEEILNFSLLTYLLHTQTHIKYLERFLEQLKKIKNFKFIGAYFDVTSEMPSYIKYLNIQWPEVFFTALEKHTLSERQNRKYSIYSLYYSDDDTIKLMNQDNCLCDYISNARDYFKIDNADIEKLIRKYSIYSLYYSDDDTIKLMNQDNCLCDYISNARDYFKIDNADIEKLILRGYNKIFDFRSRPKFQISEENEKLLTAFKKRGLIENFKESLDRERYYKIYNKIFDFRSRPKFQISEENEKLLTAFKKRGLIENFKESLDRERYYKIVRIKSKSR